MNDEARGGLAGVLAVVRALEPAGHDTARVDQLRLLEELKSAAAAAQAAVTAAFASSRRAVAATAGEPVDRQDRGVASQVALARRVSPWQARRYVGWCAVLTRELPATFAELRAGRVSERRAILVARETLFLSRQDRAVVDAELAGQLSGWSDRRVEAEARRAAYRLDPAGFVDRSRAAAKDRRVSVRPAPDTMCRLTALLPVAQGVAAYAALGRHADLTVAAGDDRGRGQVMADTLVERLTGQASAPAVPVEVELVMTDRTLLAGDTEPAELVGYGPIPAGIARALALAGGDGAEQDTDAPRWLRRLFRDPATGELAAMETRARTFTANQRRFVRFRDQARCRTPWCDAPVRHTDHVQANAAGGRTAVDNAAGRCEACNYAKQATGWQETTTPEGAIETSTPTGHRYRSRAPDPPRASEPTGHVQPARDLEPVQVGFRVRRRIVDLVYHHAHAS
ncbi:DUF222 domain-containing protein [uncultured Jatrophihabitans sp.]|uniref:HNH endonuclease n=1 Tax=uncultured Jatrophihabitans sp. TaxID=1610747 RepID=UPI0035CAA3FE